jgi:hypothetical protein
MDRPAIGQQAFRQGEAETARGTGDESGGGHWNRGMEGRRARGLERGSAKVQIGAELLCKSAKVFFKS